VAEQRPLQSRKTPRWSALSFFSNARQNGLQNSSVQPNIDVKSIHAKKLAYLAVENEVSEFFRSARAKKILISKMGN
jgi:hypothetical protein